MAPVTSNQTYVCAACLGPIGAGRPFVNCHATGDRYHVHCWATLEERPAAVASRPRGKRTNTRTRMQPARV